MKVQLLDYQAELLLSEAPLTALISGVAAGKTYVGSLWSATQSLNHHPKLGIICSGTFPQLRLNVIECLIQHQDEWELSVRHFPSLRQVAFYWPLPSGKTMETRAWALGLEEPHRARGASVPFVYCDEGRQISRDAFQVLLTRAREGKQPQVKLTSTPNGFDWMYDLFVAGDGAKPGPKVHLITGVETKANPWLPPVFLETLASHLDPTAWLQEARGMFVQSAEGRVYHQFNRARHVTEKAEYDPALAVVLAWDFNILGSCVLMQTHRDVLWVFDEVQISRSWTPEVLTEILRRYWEGQFPPGHSLQAGWSPARRPKSWAIAGDATGLRGSSSSQVSDYDHIRKALRTPSQEEDRWGYKEVLRRANPSVRDRTNKVNALLLAADGQTRLTIHPRCKNLIRDLEQVAFKPGTGEIDKTRHPHLTHLSDALGYGCYAMFPWPDLSHENRVNWLER